ncbi:MAG: DUF2757 family protein [Firmicutes bacterium]|nr:DUF2757 family protein [Bacillota bacterium]
MKELFITWICQNCHKKVMHADMREEDPRAVTLTAESGDDIIERDHEGNLTVYLLCEECLEAANGEEDSEITFLRGPELH